MTVEKTAASFRGMFAAGAFLLGSGDIRRPRPAPKIMRPSCPLILSRGLRCRG